MRTTTESLGRLALLVVLLLAIAVWVGKAQAGWTCRKQISIDYGDVPLTDYPVLIQLTPENFAYADLASADGDDIRFSTEGTGSLLPDCDYWIESWSYDGISRIWVEVPSISAGETTVCMYYGNAGAPAASNGEATFTVFDDFSGGGITNSLLVLAAGDSWFAEENGRLHMVTTQISDGYVMGLMQPDPFFATMKSEEGYDDELAGSTWELLGLHDWPEVPTPMPNDQWNPQRRFMIKRKNITYDAYPAGLYIQAQFTGETEWEGYWNGTEWTAERNYYGGPGEYTLLMWDDGYFFGADILDPDGVSIFAQPAIAARDDIRPFVNGRLLCCDQAYTSHYYGAFWVDDLIVRKYMYAPYEPVATVSTPMDTGDFSLSGTAVEASSWGSIKAQF